MVLVEEGSFWMGSEDAFAYPADGEGPVREVETRAFWIDAYAVTNDRFGAFVEETSHVTEAEQFGWSFVFGGRRRYRVAARMGNEPDSSTGNLGFRGVRDA